jgi:hypothetical protein
MELAGDLVAKIVWYCSQIYLVGDFVGDLAGHLAGETVAKNCYHSKTT